MQYHLNQFPFEKIGTKILIPDEDRFGEENFDYSEEEGGEKISVKEKIKRFFSPKWKLSKKETIKHLRDHSMALQIAEEQIAAIIKPQPFIPEYVGFTSRMVTIIMDAPGGEATKKTVMGYLKGDNMLVSHSHPGHWTLHNANTGEKRLDLLFPNAMVAFMTLGAMGIIELYKINTK